MRQPSPDTLPRPRDLSDRSDPAVLYVRSYLLIRTVVGVMGMLLPLVLIAGESWVRGDGLHVGSSLSSYYHTSMQDVFVGALCIIAVLLATYLAGRPWTGDFWLSLLAGLALLGVVFFPIGRPGVPAGAPGCGSTPTPPGCSPLEQLLGEVRTEHVHLIAAGGCFLLLAALSFLFARRERAHGHLTAASFHGLCGVVVLLGIAAAGLGNYVEFDVGPLPLLFAGETSAIWAFAASWLLAGRDLWLRLLRPRRGTPGAHSAEARRSDAQRRLLLDGSPVVAQPSPGPTPDTNRAPGLQPCGFYPDPHSEEQHPWNEPVVDGYSPTALTRPVTGPSVGSGPDRDVDVPQPRGSSEHRDGLLGSVSTDRAIDAYGVQRIARCGRCDDPFCAGHSASTEWSATGLLTQGSSDVTCHPSAAVLPTNRYEREPADERWGMAEVAELAARLAVSCPDGDRVLPRLERWVDSVGTGMHSTSSKPWDEMPGEPMWYVGVHMWSWRVSTPGNDRGRTLSANLATFIDANGAPVAPAQPGARFRGSYRPVAEALRKRMEERSARMSVSPFPGAQEPALQQHAATSRALLAADHGTSDPEIPDHVEEELGLRLDVLRLSAELDQAREALQRLLYLCDEPGSNRDDRA